MEENNFEEQEMIEEFVMLYKEQLVYNEREAIKITTEMLLKKFHSLIMKYLGIICPYYDIRFINFKDRQVKKFMNLFLDDMDLKFSMATDKLSEKQKDYIFGRVAFLRRAFICEESDDIILDLQEMFLKKVKKYEKTDRNFCGYIYNVFPFEVARYVKKRMMDPMNNPDRLHYDGNILVRHGVDKDYYSDVYPIEYWHEHYDDTENEMLSENWILGKTCDDLFADFSPLERTAVSNYYMHSIPDSKTAEMIGKHINTVNQAKRRVVKTLSSRLGIKPVRTRNSGKNII